MNDLLKKEIIKVANKNNLIFENNFLITKNNNQNFGDFSTNFALINAKKNNLTTLDIANIIIKDFDYNKTNIDKITFEKPGFINFFVNNNHYLKIIKNATNKEYGKIPIDLNNIFNIEFVSANPTGFLHVAHARGAAFGDSLANILAYQGINVIREYYINDAGNQIDNLAISVFIRYKQLFGCNIELPADSYHGDDIIWAAKKIKEEIGNKWENEDFENIKEEIKDISLNIMIAKIKQDLKLMNVHFDIWFSEKSLYKNDLIFKEINKLKGIYKKDNALWLKTSAFGDDKDRVLIKSDGRPTYFLPDIIYHNIKATRDINVKKLINVWGADHLGYIKRMEIALKLQGIENKLDVITIQLVKLIKDGIEVKMSKRKGTSLYLSELIHQVGKDSARFFLINRSVNSQIDFDLDLANLKTNDNPVFIIQYSHARICQLMKKANFNIDNIDFDNNLKINQNWVKLINLFEKFPFLLSEIKQNYKVHLLAQYLIDLAKEYNQLYALEKIIGNKNENILLFISYACGNILKIGLNLIGVNAPERM